MNDLAHFVCAHSVRIGPATRVGTDANHGSMARLTGLTSVVWASVWTCLGTAGTPPLSAEPCEYAWQPTFSSEVEVDDVVHEMIVFDDGSGPALYVGGDFSSIGGEDMKGIARWDGENWSAIGANLEGHNPSVYAMAVHDDGSGPALYLGGNFTAAGGIEAKNIVRWDGETWSALGKGVGEGIYSSVFALGVFDDGSGEAIYAGGNFTTAGGTDTFGIARWDGQSWSSLGSGVDGRAVGSLSVYDDGTGPALYVGGEFDSAGGHAANHIARWDGREWSVLGNGMDHWVSASTVFDDGSGPALYVGGKFATADGVAVDGLARWDGAAWSPVGGGVGGIVPAVSSLSTFDDGTGPILLAGGRFNEAGGVAASHIAQWNGEAWAPLGAGMSGFMEPTVRSMTTGPESDGPPTLYVGGTFATAGNMPSSHIAKWDCAATPVPGDLTGDGTVGGADLGVLLSHWGTCDDCEDCPADLTGDCKVDGADLGVLLSKWTPK